MRNRVTLHIAGESYIILTEDSESYMQKIAELVDGKIAESKAIPGVSTMQSAVLAACNLADDYYKAVRSADNLRVQIKNYLDESNSLRRELADMKHQLALAETELDAVRAELSEDNTKSSRHHGKNTTSN